MIYIYIYTLYILLGLYIYYIILGLQQVDYEKQSDL